MAPAGCSGRKASVSIQKDIFTLWMAPGTWCRSSIRKASCCTTSARGALGRENFSCRPDCRSTRVTAHARQSLDRRRFLQLQRKIDLSGFRATRFLAGRLEAEHAHFNGTIARRRRGERVVTALVGGGDEFPIANAGRDRRAGNWLVRRLDEAALGIQPSAGGQQRKEKKTMLRQNLQMPPPAPTAGDRQPLPVKIL